MATTTASKEFNEDRIYHISGHALLAVNAGFPIELLSVNGFSGENLVKMDVTDCEVLALDSGVCTWPSLFQRWHEWSVSAAKDFIS